MNRHIDLFQIKKLGKFESPSVKPPRLAALVIKSKGNLNYNAWERMSTTLNPEIKYTDRVCSFPHLLLFSEYSQGERPTRMKEELPSKLVRRNRPVWHKVWTVAGVKYTILVSCSCSELVVSPSCYSLNLTMHWHQARCPTIGSQPGTERTIVKNQKEVHFGKIWDSINGWFWRKDSPVAWWLPFNHKTLWDSPYSTACLLSPTQWSDLHSRLKFFPASLPTPTFPDRYFS